jgi:hypothetical protein
MIIEMYIIFQVLVFLLLYLGWKDKSPIYWILSFIFSSIQVFTSYNIEYIVMVYSNLGELTSEIVSYSFPILSYVNIIFVAVSLIMFFWDIFNPKELER